MLKRNETLSSLTWEMLARKNIKKHKRLVLRLEALYLVKNIFYLYYSPITKLWPRKKKLFLKFSFFEGIPRPSLIFLSQRNIFLFVIAFVLKSSSFLKAKFSTLSKRESPCIVGQKSLAIAMMTIQFESKNRNHFWKILKDYMTIISEINVTKVSFF